MAIASTIYAAFVSLFMLFSMQALLKFDLRTEFGTLSLHLIRGACQAFSVIFLVGLIVETARLVAAI